jgi:hypothetical protein
MNQLSAQYTLMSLALLTAAMTGGCAGRPLVETPLEPPLDPVPSPAEQAENWYFAWEMQRDVTSSSPQSMLLIAGGEGREWRTPPGPDGYVVRAVLLDDRGRPTRAEGEFEAFVVHQPAGPDPEPLFAWSVSPAEAAKRYHEGITPGYLLELDWGPGATPPTGQKMLVVRWEGPAGQRITRNVAFEDGLDHGIQTITERP